MGKKRITKQSTQEVLQEEAKIAARQKKAQESGSRRRASRGHAYIQSSYNNTLITITDEKGKVLTWSSAGSLGFKGPKKATPYAASKVVETLAERMKKSGLREIHVFVKGIGSGRESAIRAFAGNGIDVLSIRDVTPIAFNGPRARKPRRV